MGKFSLNIKNFGPIKEAAIGVKDFLVLTGPQASGKSTVAKLIYFFLNIKQLIVETQLNYTEESQDIALLETVNYNLQERFFDIFGDGCCKKDTEIKFIYDSGEYVEISYFNPAELRLNVSDQIERYINEHATEYKYKKMPAKDEIKTWRERLDCLLGKEKVIYIPAGRNITATLGKYLNYWFATMDDTQKKQIDYFSRKYIEEVMRMDPMLERGVSGLCGKYRNNMPKGTERLISAFTVLTAELLKGEYRYKHGVEKLILDNGDDIEIKYASSGQQEAVWITNILMYYMLAQEKVRFIIEEPEAHLFPDGQRLVTRLIAVAHNAGNNVVLTTHSPYILGALNNLIFAEKISEDVDRNELSDIVTDFEYLKYEACGAFFIRGGMVESCLEPELPGIKNEVIDDAAIVINDQFEDMLSLKREK